ncbi:MAG: hypothetical protein QXO16_04750 [Archaeoglobaceae archaeon]
MEILSSTTDPMMEAINELVSKIKRDKDFEVRVIRLPKNYGFAVANNIAYAQRSPDAKYID